MDGIEPPTSCQWQVLYPLSYIQLPLLKGEASVTRRVSAALPPFRGGAVLWPFAWNVQDLHLASGDVPGGWLRYVPPCGCRDQIPYV